ncbi:MAG TPA: hypothetical protein VGO68_08465 [Pyrinomonadaceae bacterium]|jgi:hypothetical protein|nr:hypothetical protein [Pyrinomonadaceae bacterium]
MNDDKTKDPAHHEDQKGPNDASHDEPSEHSSEKHKPKKYDPNDAIAPADDEIIIK